jgi:hypothetical protein
MNASRLSGLALLALVTLSCSAAPIKISAGDQCYRCRRSINSELVAGEAVYGPQFVAKFRGPGCMAKYLVDHKDEKPTLFVTDFKTGKMMPPQNAFYVPEVVDRTTGETDYRAYRQQADAAAYAAEVHAQPIGWDAVLEQAR